MNWKTVFSTLGVIALAISHPLAAQDVAGDDMDALDDAGRADLAGNTTALVAAVLYEGEADLLASWGRPGPDSSEELNSQYFFAWPALTEMMLATTVRALHDAGQIDANQPLGQFVPGLPQLFRTMTLDQLLTHRAGLDDAPATEGMTWDNLLEELPDEARLAPPGTLFSYSRYSYPVLGRIMEILLGATVGEIAQFAIIGPLGMTRTSFDRSFAEAGGLATGTPATAVEARQPWQLPAAYTTSPDVLQFMAAWMGGAIRGTTPGAAAPEFDLGGHTFTDGLWMETLAGVNRFWRTERELGFSTEIELFPHATTASFFWGNGMGARRVRDAVSRDIGFGLGVLGQQPAPGTPGEEIDEGWAGTYLNGDLMVVLEATEEGSIVYFDGNRRVPLERTDVGSYVVTGPAGGMVELTARTIGAEQVIYLGPRAYLHTDQEFRTP